MSKGTLERLSVRYFRTAIDDLNIEETERGSRVIRALPVFRSGTFKDSWGDPHTWEVEHLEQMVFNFNLLRSRGVLRDVPIRDGHGGLFGGGDIVGYIEDLYTISGYEDGHTRLLADLDITEPDAYGKIERGTWRGRSAEIGFYETNDEVMYWPVFMGVAWVDIPAVEGLFENHNNSKNSDKFTAIRDSDQEGAVAGTKKQVKEHDNGGAGGDGGTPPAQQQQQSGTEGGGTEGGGSTEGGDEGGTEGGGTEGAGTEGGGTEGGGGGGQTPPPTQQHSSPNGTLTFTVNGQPTTDHAAVQSHITSLEEFAREQREEGRKNFVKALAERNLIAATQVDAMTNHALSLNDQQWSEFKKMYPEDAAPAPLFGHHGTDGSESHPSGDSPSEIDTLRETVAMHKRAEMPEAKIKETQSYKRLMELTDGKG